jgi:hypothetical protein
MCGNCGALGAAGESVYNYVSTQSAAGNYQHGMRRYQGLLNDIAPTGSEIRLFRHGNIVLVAFQRGDPRLRQRDER